MAASPAHAAALDRATRLGGELRERSVDVLLVETPINLRYLTGFTGSNGLALIAAGAAKGEPNGRPGHRFLTDFRYATQSGEEVPPEFEREVVAGELLDAAVRSLPEPGGRLGFDDATLPVARHRKLQDLLPPAWELVACAGMVERLRAVKESAEVALIRSACELAEEALRDVLDA
ncbi:MAG TPA: aminopeptidase P family N-terminal domain-containing protein, partial [Solirubrobacteraceae bacterium]|nr:aminopeptidase P family N-terminal domain-containing protein [Solirubrobacteraceae bacterium]